MSDNWKDTPVKLNSLDFINEHIELFQKARELMPQVDLVAQKIKLALSDGRCIFIAGNGGSAGDAQHFSAELVGRFELERRPLPSVSLTTDTSAITAIANDYGYEHVFSRQLRGLAKPGDLFFGISTSGRSKSITNAISAADQLDMETILLTSVRSSSDLATYTIRVPSTKTAYIQEMHIFIIHCICRVIDQGFKQ